MRRDYSEFVDRGAEVIVVGPEGPDRFRRYWEIEGMPFVGLADPSHEVASLYGQKVNWLKLGRMPAVFVVDRAGRIHLSHYANSMADIPANSRVLALLDRLNAESRL